MVDYKALYEEEKRQRQEAERQRQEAERQRQEEQRRRQEEQQLRQEEQRRRQEEQRRRQDAERRRQDAERETERIRLEARVQAELERQANQALIMALAASQRETAEARQTQADQALHPYLALVSRLHTHLMRLIPLPKLDHPSGTSSSFATSGQTTIEGKYYPLAIRAWTEFPSLHKDTFSRILTATANRANFPSLANLRVHEEDLLQPLPLNLLQTPKFLNENKTTAFLKIALHKPVACVLHRFLEATHSDERLVFDSSNTTKTAESTGTDSGESSGDPVPPAPPQTASPPNQSPVKPSLKATPDIVVFAMSADTPAAQSVAGPPVPPPRWIAVGEHKPCHALRHAVVRQIVQGPLPETCMVRLAREASARSSRAQQSQDGGARQAIATSTGLPSPRSSAKRVPKQVYFAHALTQTYHYMLVSGLEYGFLATGETLTVLRIPEDDPHTLLYHTSVFPVPTPESLSSFSGPVLTVPPITATDPADEEALFALPVAQLCSLSLLARESGSSPRNALWISHTLSGLAPFPNLPSSIPPIQDPPSPLGPRPRDSDDDDNDNGGDPDDNSRQPRRRMLQPPGPRHASQVRTPSPLQRVSSAGDNLLERAPAPGSANYGKWMRERGVARKPQLPYCTQACLLGLVQGGSLDRSCPNAQLHFAADTASATHPITQGRLVELVRAQLFNAPEYDIECLSDKGSSGAIGELLKITVTAYGYTFVAKGVERHHRRRLRHEARMYGHLRPQQGALVPVCLGLVQLVAPYPVPQSFKVLPALLLLAYGGESVRATEQKLQLLRAEGGESVRATEQKLQLLQAEEGGDAAALPVGVDLDHEAARTLDALARLGLYDRDDNPANLLWCAETRRVMRIDFERAVWLGDADGRAAKRDHDSDSTPRPEKRTKRRSSAAPDAGVDADGNDNTADQAE